MKTHSRTEPVASPDFISTQTTGARRYYFNLHPKPGRQVEIVCGGCERMRPDYIVERSSFPFSTIELVAEGCGLLELAGTSYRLKPGMTFAYGPGIAHVIRNDPAQPMLKYYVSFVGREAARILAESVLRPGQAVQLSSPQEVVDIFELFQREGANGTGSGARICAALLPVLLLTIKSRLAAQGSAELRIFVTYERARRMIEQRFMDLPSVAAAAQACHLDPSYLCRLFQRFAHTSPSRFLTRLKMSRAAELLLDERMLVKEAASTLGFADAFQFSRTFKRIYGISPARFVRQNDRGTTPGK